MSRKGLILVVSGFSGVGKGTIVRRLLEKYDNYALSVSVTTRAPREGERHGREYFFISEEQFTSMAEKRRADRIRGVRGPSLRHAPGLCGPAIWTREGI